MAKRQINPSPQVRERHENAIYINIPISPSEIAPLLQPPAQPDIYNGSAWLSIVIDALYSIESPFCGSWIKPPGMQKKYMMKVNVLVKAPLPTGGPPVSGYQIVYLSFEQSFGGRIMRLGSLATQKVQTTLMKPVISLGEMGTNRKHRDYKMGEGDQYSAKLVGNNIQNILVDIKGVVTEPLIKDSEFYKFVVERGVKYLAQGATLVGSAWAEGYESSAENVLGLKINSLNLPILKKILNDCNISDGYIQEKAIVFYQKFYAMIDCVNQPIPNNE